MVAEGRVEEGLTRLEQIMKAAPTNAEHRTNYLAARDQAIVNWLEQAERARHAGRHSEADALYKRVLVIDPANPRALTALDESARQAQHAELYTQAHAAWQANDSEGALARLRTILGENPRHRRAAELRRAIEERIARNATHPTLAEGLRKPLTIEFRDAPMRQVFEVFARTSGLNFVFDRDVRNDLRVTLFLRNTTIQDALNMVLLTNQLEHRILDANSIVVYPNTPAKAREYQQLVVRTFFLNNADVKTVGNTLRTIIRTRDLVIDEKQNMIVMRDTPEAVRLAERLLALHDMPEPEVMLEVEVLEVKRSRLLELGIQWPNQIALSPLSTTGGTTLTLQDLRSLTARSVGVAIDPVLVNLRRQDGVANLLANPRIRSRNREKARILVGDRVPVITTTATATGFVSEAVTYVDVGLKLEVEPTVYMDDEVAIKVTLEVSNIVSQVQTRSGSIAYQIGTRNANSVLRLRDGENQVLAGLINDEDRRAGSRVPGLGQLPVVGRLFGSQRDDAQQTEIVLSITPRIIRNPQRPAFNEAEIDAGTEASLRNRGLEGTAPLQIAPGAPGLPPAPGVPPPSLAPAVPPAPAAPGSAPTSVEPRMPPVTFEPRIPPVTFEPRVPPATFEPRNPPVTIEPRMPPAPIAPDGSSAPPGPDAPPALLPLPMQPPPPPSDPEAVSGARPGALMLRAEHGLAATHVGAAGAAPLTTTIRSWLRR
jgi:general secretion pathway protein D